MNKLVGKREKKGVNLLVLGNLSFPRGRATTSRISTYAKGVIENNGTVTILCVGPGGHRTFGDSPIAASGTIDGIKYVYAAGVTMCPESFWAKIFLGLKGLLKSFVIIWKANRVRKVDALLFFSTYALHEILFTLLARYLRIPVIREKCEYPFRDRTTFWKKLKAYLYEKFVDRLFDGMIFITRFLENYYKPLMRKDAKYILVPILVEVSRFEGIVSADDKGKYIAYCGDPSGNKDGVPILIEAFSRIAEKYSDLRLYIIGASHDKKVLPSLRERARQLQVEDRVVFTGKISPEDMPQYLCHATVLALARPTSLQAQGGFPTKLGEYLATGKPVVVTNVGEIGEFLRDGESAFIAPPNSEEAFAAKLDYVLAHPKLAQEVGLTGKEVALTNFNYKVHGKRIVNFVQKLKG